MVEVYARDIRFLRDIGDNDEDNRCRTAARDALAAFSPVGDEPSGDPGDTALRLGATAATTLHAFVDGRGFPDDLAPLRDLSASNAEYLLTRLLDLLLSLAHTDASSARLREATTRLHAVREALEGARAVRARLTDPRRVTVPDHLARWAGSLLAVVHPRDILAAAELLAARPSTRLSALRWLGEAAERIGAGTAPATDVDPLYLLVTTAFPPFDRRSSGAAFVPEVTDAGTATRTAYPLLDAPERVAPGAELELRVGLAASPGAGVASPGAFAVPTEPFTVTVVLSVDGFTVLGGGSTTRRIRVTPQDPYPYEVVRLRADDRPGLRQARAVLAIYSVDGQQIGIASRAVVVGEAPVGEPPAPGVDWVLPAGAPGPDLELVLAPGNDDAGSMHWHFRSPHEQVGESRGFLTVTPGRDVAATARRFLGDIENRAAYGDLAEQVNFVAGRLGELVHPRVWQALARAADAVNGPPTVLFATADPYLPWELARVPAPWTSGPPLLGAQAVVGRWPYSTPARTPAPPATLDAAAMAVVTGRYPDAIRLEQAEAEGEELCARYGATPVAPAVAEVVALLRGRPEADVLHVALHGAFDVTGTRDGILMVDGRNYLRPQTVEGVEASPVRFAFLNACQVGQGSVVLGQYAGMAEALLRIGVVAVVAPLWKVDDEVARGVAAECYESVLGSGLSPAAFLRHQRGRDVDVRTTRDSSRLAYVYFGHPLLRVRWHGKGGHA